MIYHQREVLSIRWELIVLSAITLLILPTKFLYFCLFPANNAAIGNSFNFFDVTEAVLLNPTIDIVYVFIAGLFLVNALHIGEIAAGTIYRRNYFILYILFLLLVVAIDCCIVWFFKIKFEKTNKFLCLLYFINFLKIFIYSLILESEKILLVVRSKKEFFICPEMIVLSIIAFLLSSVKLWTELFFAESGLEIIRSINTSYLWQIAYPLAAGIFLVQAFQIKTGESMSSD